MNILIPCERRSRVNRTYFIKLKPFYPVQPENSFLMSIWGCCGANDLKRLDRLSKKSMRLILSSDIFV